MRELRSANESPSLMEMTDAEEELIIFRLEKGMYISDIGCRIIEPVQFLICEPIRIFLLTPCESMDPQVENH